MPPITARSWHWKWRLFVIVLIVVFYIELDLSEGSVSHPCWGKMLPNPTLCADCHLKHWSQIMAGIVSHSFASLPAELLELVCSFLNARYTSFQATIIFVNFLNAKYREVAWYITFPKHCVFSETSPNLSLWARIWGAGSMMEKYGRRLQGGWHTGSCAKSDLVS